MSLFRFALLLSILVAEGCIFGVAAADSEESRNCAFGKVTENGCDCFPFFSGSQCDIPCPGLYDNDCFDAKCHGLNVTECGDAPTCIFDIVSGICLGPKLCLPTICNNAGTCRFGADQPGICECFETYGGENCELTRSSDSCFRPYGVVGSTSGKNVSSVCPTASTLPNKDGGGVRTVVHHYADVESLCLTCASGWYGSLFNLECSCNGHGWCDRIFGDRCVCYDDDEQGHWTGSQCDRCMEEYMGVECTERNHAFAEVAHMRASFGESKGGDASAQKGVLVGLSKYSAVAGLGDKLMCMSWISVEANEEPQQGDIGEYTAPGIIWATLVTSRVDDELSVDAESERNGELRVLVVAMTPHDSSCTITVLESSYVHAHDCDFVVVQVEERSVIVDEDVVVDAKLSRAYGWFVLTRSGAVLSEKYGDFGTGEAFAAETIAVSEATGTVCVAGSQKGAWAVYVAELGAGATTFEVVTASSVAFIGDVSIVTPLSTYTTASYAEETSMNNGSTKDLLVLLSTANRTAVVLITPSADGSDKAYVEHAQLPLITPAHMTSLSMSYVASLGAVYVLMRASDGSTWLSSVVHSINSLVPLLLVSHQQTHKSTERAVFLAHLDGWHLLSLIHTTGGEGTDEGEVLDVSLYTAYAIANAASDFVDRRGGDVLNVFGFFFAHPMQCYFDGNNTTLPAVMNINSANTISSTMLQCVVPPLVSLPPCVQAHVAVSSATVPAPALAALSSIPIQALLSRREVSVTVATIPGATSWVPVNTTYAPLIVSATSGDTDSARAFIDDTRDILVLGQDFRLDKMMQCRFEDERGVLAVAKAELLSSQSLLCILSKEGVPAPSAGETGTISVSMNGIVFSNKIPFTFVGHARRLVPSIPSTSDARIVNNNSAVCMSALAAASYCPECVTESSPVRVKVKSAHLSALPPLCMRVVDDEGHALQELDMGRVVRLKPSWFYITRQFHLHNSSVRKKLSAHMGSTSDHLVVAAYINQTRDGETCFSVSLQYPLVGIGKLSFSSDELDSAAVLYEVSEGAPYTTSILVEPSRKFPNNPSVSPPRQPVATLHDEADNQVLFSKGVPEYFLTLEAEFPYVVYTNSTTIGRVPVVATRVVRSRQFSNGYYTFDSVLPTGLYGQDYRVSVCTVNDSGTTAISSVKVEPALCVKDQYAVYGTVECSACPPHAKCDGSFILDAAPGYWKGGILAYSIYPCSPPEACAGGKKDGCAVGYMGPMCSLCSTGQGAPPDSPSRDWSAGLQRRYARSGRGTCEACGSSSSNAVAATALVILCVVLLIALAAVLAQGMSSYKRVAHIVLSMVDFLQLVCLLALQQQQLPDALISPAARHFLIFLHVVAMSSIQSLFVFQCLITTSGFSSFVVSLVSPFLAAPIAWLVALYAASLSAERLLPRAPRDVTAETASSLPAAAGAAAFAATATTAAGALTVVEGSGVAAIMDTPSANVAALSSALSAATATRSAVPLLVAVEEERRQLAALYAQCDRNILAQQSIAQLPSGATRDTALRLLTEEHEELLSRIAALEERISLGSDAGIARKGRSATLSADSVRGGSRRRGRRKRHTSTGSLAGDKDSDHLLSARARRQSDRSGAAAGTEECDAVDSQRMAPSAGRESREEEEDVDEEDGEEGSESSATHLHVSVSGGRRASVTGGRQRESRGAGDAGRKCTVSRSGTIPRVTVPSLSLAIADGDHDATNDLSVGAPGTHLSFNPVHVDVGYLEEHISREGVRRALSQRHGMTEKKDTNKKIVSYASDNAVGAPRGYSQSADRDGDSLALASNEHKDVQHHRWSPLPTNLFFYFCVFIWYFIASILRSAVLLTYCISIDVGTAAEIFPVVQGRSIIVSSESPEVLAAAEESLRLLKPRLHSLLLIDLSKSCDTADYKAWRLCGIVVTALLLAVPPLLHVLYLRHRQRRRDQQHTTLVAGPAAHSTGTQWWRQLRRFCRMCATSAVSAADLAEAALGVRKGCAWWGVWLCFRRPLLALVVTLLVDQPVPAVAVCSWLLVFSFAACQIVSPYSNTSLNALQGISCLLLLVVISCSWGSELRGVSVFNYAGSARKGSKWETDVMTAATSTAVTVSGAFLITAACLGAALHVVYLLQEACPRFWSMVCRWVALLLRTIAKLPLMCLRGNRSGFSTKKKKSSSSAMIERSAFTFADYNTEWMNSLQQEEECIHSEWYSQRHQSGAAEHCNNFASNDFFTPATSAMRGGVSTALARTIPLSVGGLDLEYGGARTYTERLEAYVRYHYVSPSQVALKEESSIEDQYEREWSAAPSHEAEASSGAAVMKAIEKGMKAECRVLQKHIVDLEVFIDQLQSLFPEE